MSQAFSTYSDEEVAAITSRLEDCRKRFASEGSERKATGEMFLHIFQDVRDGNGGSIPLIDDWQRMFRQLCARNPDK